VNVLFCNETQKKIPLWNVAVSLYSRATGKEI